MELEKLQLKSLKLIKIDLVLTILLCAIWVALTYTSNNCDEYTLLNYTSYIFAYIALLVFGFNLLIFLKNILSHKKNTNVKYLGSSLLQFVIVVCLLLMLRLVDTFFCIEILDQNWPVGP